ncbi:MAG: hypothetical protein NWR50_04625 [Crocinitomicaceae bacterium]|nr:hypothetical protein [Crocinitomicaceae bacterium]
MKTYTPLSKLILILFLFLASNADSQVLDTLDGVTKMTTDGH